MCGDYRGLNAVTTRESYPSPLPEEIFERLGNKKYFSTLDLRSGFNQIPIAEEDKHKTAFHGVGAHSEYNRMPFGLVNASAVFQRVMDEVLRGLEHSTGCFIDDILLASDTIEEHLALIAEVLRRLKEAGLKCHHKKCRFFFPHVEYLGHAVGQGGLAPQEAKVACIDALPAPSNVGELRSFLGMVNYYRRHINNFSSMARPLN